MNVHDLDMLARRDINSELEGLVLIDECLLPIPPQIYY